MKKMKMITGILSLFAVTAFARPFSVSEVPADSKWVAYANTANVRDSQLGGFIIDSMDEKDRSKLEGFEAIFNFDLIEDIDSVLLYGPTLEDDGDGVLVLSGNFDEGHLTTLLKMNDTYASRDHGGTVIHNWVDDKNKGKDPEVRTYGAFAVNGDILLGDTEELVAQSLDVLMGRVLGLSGESALNLSSRGDAVFMAAALEVSEGTTLPAKAAMLRQTRNMFLSMREVDGKLLTELEINTDNAEAAFYVDSIVRGMLAMAFLYDEARPGLSELARGVKVNTIDQRVLIESAYPVEQVIDTLKQMEKKKKK